VAEIAHPALTATVRAVLADRDLAAYPATADDHHSYAGGLLEHTVGVATLCRETSQLHPRLRPDLLLAAALVHDVGRTIELGRGPAFAVTDEGPPAGSRASRPPADRGTGTRAHRRPARRALALRRRAPRCARGTHRRGCRALPREPARRDRRDPPRRLTPLLLALGASLAWGISDFVGPLVGRTLGTLRVLFWAQIGGLLAIGLAVAIRGQGPAGWAVLFAILASIGGMLGLFAYYRGIQQGAISVVAPIAGVSAIVPVIFGIATGDSPSALQLMGVACALLGVALASIEHHEGSRRFAAGAGLALLAAAGFGFYFPWMHAAGKVDFWWAVAHLPHGRAAPRRGRRRATASADEARQARPRDRVSRSGSATRSATCSSPRRRGRGSSA